jgi:hypothetical protein
MLRLSGATFTFRDRNFPNYARLFGDRLINIPSIIFYYLKVFLPINLGIAQHWVIKSPDFMNFSSFNL